MVTNNKVLTVSYGTFSCTLEGFDDSFDTMKAIAEYFRDLAADDRYFGAEPPTPDAEMLARIAEREIERRVQARTEHGAIFLSADAAEAAVPAKPAEAPVETAREEAEVAAEPLEQAADAVAEDEAYEVEEEIETPDVAADVLQAVIAEDEVVEPTPAPEAVAEEAEAEETHQEIEEIAPEALAEVAEVKELAEEPVEEEVAVVEDVEEDDVAAIEEPAEEIEEFAPEAFDDLSETKEAEELVAHEEVAEDEDDSSDIMIAGILNTTDEEEEEDHAFFEPELVEPDMPEIAEEEEAETNSIAAKLARIRAVVSKSRTEIVEDDFSEDEHADDIVSDSAEAHDNVLHLNDEMAAAAAAMDAMSEEADEEHAEAPVRPIRARVIRMKKAAFETAVDNGMIEAEAIEEDEDEDDLASTSSLSAEEEAELLAELAQVEAELSGEQADEDDDDPVTPIGADPDAAVRSERGRHLSETAGQSESDMARLMQETDFQMDEPDGSRRRQAIAHLRAAVAATKAEQSAGQADKEPRDVSEAYREDLSSALRPVQHKPTPDSKPRRPHIPEQVERRESPLKLVAEQRVDRPEPQQPAAETEVQEAPRAPVRPRRVSASEKVEADSASGSIQDVSGFSEFAESVGARELHEVLEAAAAYLTFVEGREVFSRPMIVRLAQAMNDGEFTREDSLRGFGQLLRENKIEKVAGGRFAVSEDIGFRPEDRAFG